MCRTHAKRGRFCRYSGSFWWALASRSKQISRYDSLSSSVSKNRTTKLIRYSAGSITYKVSRYCAECIRSCRSVSSSMAPATKIRPKRFMAFISIGANQESILGTLECSIITGVSALFTSPHHNHKKQFDPKIWAFVPMGGGIHSVKGSRGSRIAARPCFPPFRGSM